MSREMMIDPPASLRQQLNFRAAIFGIVSGTKEISDTLAMAAFLFAGELAAGYGLAATIFLVGAIVIRLAVAMFSRLPNAVGGPQEIGLSVIAGLMVGVPAASGSVQAGVATALAICGVTTILTGFAFALTGYFKIAHFARLLPYPVLGGFFAGSGWLLVSGGLAVALAGTGDHVPTRFLNLLADTNRLLILLPTASLAVTLLIVLRKWSIAAPAVLIGSVAVFYLTLWAFGVPLEAARSYGWIQSIASMNDTIHVDAAMLGLVNWHYLFASIPLILAATALSTIGVLLNLGGLSLTTRSDVNVNHEMVNQGLANLLIGAFGGVAGFITVGSTVLAKKLGVERRAAGLSATLLLALGLAFARPIISFVPVFVTSGLIAYTGLDLLLDWVIESRRRLPAAEWSLILLILAIIVFQGLLVGILAGMLLSVLIFAHNYAKLPVIVAIASLKELRSHVDRSPEANTALAANGEKAEFVRLHGYLFFATSETIVNHVRRRAASEGGVALRYLVLDFSQVGGCDSAAVSAFVQIRNLASRYGFIILLAGLRENVRNLFQLSDAIFTDDKIVLEFADSDHAIEYCEMGILLENEQSTDDTYKDALTYLRQTIGDHPDLATIAKKFKTRQLHSGDILIRKGDAADDIYFLLKGRVRVQIDLPNGRKLRLRSMTAGSIVGDIALYTGQRRTADVILEEDATILSLSADSLREIEESSGVLAARLHRLLARTLAEKLVVANNTIRVAQR